MVGDRESHLVTASLSLARLRQAEEELDTELRGLVDR